MAIGRTPLGKYQARVRSQNRPVYIGTYATEAEARRACTRFRMRHADEVDAAWHEQSSRTHLQQPREWRWHHRKAGEKLVGVQREKSGHYAARVQVDEKILYLGCFESKERARRRVQEFRAKLAGGRGCNRPEFLERRSRERIAALGKRKRVGAATITGELMDERLKKASAGIVPAPSGFRANPLILAGSRPAEGVHPLAAQRQEVAETEAAHRAAETDFQRELQASVRLEKVEPGWVCGKSGCEGAMEMRDGNLHCAVCGRACAPSDSALKFRQFPAKTVFVDAGAPERIREARKRMEKLGLARDAARRKLAEGGNDLNLELMAEAGRSRHRE